MHWLMKRKKQLQIAMVIVLAYACLGFFIMPLIIQNYAPRLAAEHLNGRKLSLESVDINPFALSVDINELAITHSDGKPWLGFQNFHINLQSSSLFRLAWTFKHIRLNKPYGYIAIDKQGEWAIADLLAAAEDKPDSTNNSELAVPDALASLIRIDDLKIYFSDASKAKPYKAEIGPLHVQLENFNTAKESETPYQLIADSPNSVLGDELSWTGKLTINPLRSQGDIDIKGMNIPKLWSYFSEQYNFSIQQGSVNVSAFYDFNYDANTKALMFDVRKGAVSIYDFVVDKNDNQNLEDNPKTIISIPEASVFDIAFNLEGLSLGIEKIAVNDAAYQFALLPDASVEWQQIFIPAVKGGNKTEKSNKEKPFNIDIKKIALNNNQLRYQDFSLQKTADITLKHINANLGNVILADGQVMPMALAFEDISGGAFKSEGSVQLFPSAVLDVNIELEKLDVSQANAYVAEYVNLDIKQAKFSSKAVLNADFSHQKKISLSANAELENIELHNAITGSELLEADSLLVDSLDFQLSPMAINAKTLVVNGASAKLLLDDKGQLNVSSLVKKSKAHETGASSKNIALNNSQETANDIAIMLELLQVNASRIQFNDQLIEPHFAMGLDEINGTITGLSNDTKAKVLFKAKADGYGPVNIKGDMNLLSNNIYSDISMQLQSLNLNSLSPYSGTYIGREIDKGQLFIDVNYFIENGYLKAQNHFILNQLFLGEKVASDKALKIPVGLALGLLKNAKGEIDIKLPISGDINDPNFRYGKVVAKTLTNVILKAVGSPFNLLAGLVGSKEDLSYISFTAGLAQLDENGIRKITALQKALQQRPAVNIEVAACYHPLDETLLKQQQLNASLAAIEPTAPVNAKARYHGLLAMYQNSYRQAPVYSKSLLAKEAVAEDIFIDQRSEFLNQQLLLTMDAQKDALNSLAMARQQAVVAALLSTDEIQAGRVFMSKIMAIADKKALACPLSVK